jgi:hypothetical protein
MKKILKVTPYQSTRKNLQLEKERITLEVEDLAEDLMKIPEVEKVINTYGVFEAKDYKELLNSLTNIEIGCSIVIAQTIIKKVKAKKNQQRKEIAERKVKEIAERKVKEIAERKAKEIAERKAKEIEKQERVKQRRLLIKKGEPEIDYDELIDMKKSENQFFIIFFSSIVSFFILHWIISVSGICYAIFIYNKKVLQRLKEVFGQEICEKYNNSFQKLYAEYKDDVNEEKQ